MSEPVTLDADVAGIRLQRAAYAYWAHGQPRPPKALRDLALAAEPPAKQMQRVGAYVVALLQLVAGPVPLEQFLIG